MFDCLFLKGTEHDKYENWYFLAPAQWNWMKPILLSHETLFETNLKKNLSMHEQVINTEAVVTEYSNIEMVALFPAVYTN